MTLTHPEARRFFMTIPEAVAGAARPAGPAPRGLYLLDMGEPVLIRELAEQMIRLYGYEPGTDIPIVYTGLRPGEKLQERLWAEGDSVQPTECPKLLLLDRKYALNGKLNAVLDSLRPICFFREDSPQAYRNRRMLRETLKRIIPDLRLPDESPPINSPMPAFIDDLRPDDCLAGAVARSPNACGLLRELALPELPEGCFGLSAADIPGDPILECLELRVPALAAERVLHPGQPLALLGAADAEQAAELAAAVRLAVDPEPPLAGLSDGGPRSADAGWSWRRGASAEAFAGAAHIVEGEYRCESLPPEAVDPVGAVAEWDGRVLLLHALTADPFDLRRQLARLLDLPERRVRVRTAASGPLEGRLLPALLAAAHAALLAWRSGRSVRLIYDPREQALWASGSSNAVVRHRTALDPSGVPIGAQVSLELDGGAFSPADQGALEEAVRSGAGLPEPGAGRPLVGKLQASGRSPAGPGGGLVRRRAARLAPAGGGPAGSLRVAPPSGRAPARRGKRGAGAGRGPVGFPPALRGLRRGPRPPRARPRPCAASGWPSAPRRTAPWGRCGWCWERTGS